MKKTSPGAPAPDIDSLILAVRDKRVILGADLATIYGVPTKALNQAVKRNLERFPADFMFPLTPEETETVQRSRSQFVTLKRGQNISLNIHEAAIVDVLQRIMKILDPPPPPPEPPP